MSGFCSLVLQPDLIVRITEDDSHQVCVDRLGLPDNVTGRARRFLRAVVPDGDMTRYTPDEDDPDDLPAWYTDNEAGYIEAVSRVVVAAAEVRAQIDTLRAEYIAKISVPWAEYAAKRDALWAEYDAKTGPLWAECDAKHSAAWAEYTAKRDPLQAEYDAKHAGLWATVPGYVPAPEVTP